MIEETGEGIANADTYVDPTGTFATTYVSNHLYASTWTAATPEKRVAAVIMATRILDGLYRWKGTLKGTSQGLGWPRYNVLVDSRRIEGVPTPIKQATMELAMAMLERNRLSDTNSGTQPLDKLELGNGAIVLEFGDDPTAAPTPPGRMIPPYVAALLQLYGTQIGSGMKPVSRR